MLKYFLPEVYKRSIYDIQVDFLKEKGICGVMTDLDNTLVAWNEARMTPNLRKWFGALGEAGIQTVILSNNNERRIRTFIGDASIPYVFRAKKPLLTGYQKALQIMNLTPNKTVVIGDQLMTDIWGANRIGAHSVLVAPVAASDGWATQINRLIERLILGQLRRRGWLDREER